jgi:exopolysaccharide biosynthesis polyprenyl glycosylphosphotransferase
MSDQEDKTEEEEASAGSARKSVHPPAFYQRRKKRSNEIGQVLLRNKSIEPKQLREALRLQEERGGQLGAILVELGACRSREIAEALLDRMRLDRQAVAADSIARKARENPSVVGLAVPCRPRLSLALIVFSDLVALVLAAGLTGWAMHGHVNSMPAALYSAVAILGSIAALAMQRLYTVTPPAPHDELRRSFEAITLAQVGTAIAVALDRSATLGTAHMAVVLQWAFSLLFIPFDRELLRGAFSHKSWWGQPAVVLGAGKIARAVVRVLRERPQLGLKPVALVDDDASKLGTLSARWEGDDIEVESGRNSVISGQPDSEPSPSTRDLDSPSTRAVLSQFSEVEGVPVVGTLELAPVLAHRLGVRTAIIALPDLASNELLHLVERLGEPFSRLLVIPDGLPFAYWGASVHKLGDVLGVELRRELLLPGRRIWKRVMDIVLLTLLVPFAVPLCLVIAILVRICSPGPALYRQERLGRDGERFSALKFRTMYKDAEQRLARLLESDPIAREEYEEFHKLSPDPRVTRLGSVLRKYSLDEVPQLWNVLSGDMSLVGPRPYLPSEIPDMDQQECFVLRVRPGMTGMWQVTDRNATDFAGRVRTDVEYVRNWSPWLDIYILARTLLVVVRGTGI